MQSRWPKPIEMSFPACQPLWNIYRDFPVALTRVEQREPGSYVLPLEGSQILPGDKRHSAVHVISHSIKIAKMLGKTKVGIAAAMVLLAVAIAPTVLCLGYLVQSTQTHGCCPSKTAPASTVVLTCCIQSPAVTSQNVVFAIDAVTAPAIAAEPFLVTVATRSAVPDLDTSPPQCSSVLRI